MTMCHITDLLLDGFLLAVIQHCSLVAMYKQYRCNHCLLLTPQIEFGQQIHPTPELQLALQTSFDITYFLARSFFDQRQQPGGMIYQ